MAHAAQSGEIVTRVDAAIAPCPFGCDGTLPGVTVGLAALFRSSSGRVGVGFGFEQAWFRYDPAPDVRHPTGDARGDLHARGTYLGPLARWYVYPRGPIDPYFQAGIGLGWIGSAFLEGRRSDRADAGNSAISIGFDAALGIDFMVTRSVRIGFEMGTMRYGLRRECHEEPGDPTGRCSLSVGFGTGWFRAGLVITGVVGL